MKTIYDIADSVAPFALSNEYCERYGARDNSGIQLDCGGAVACVLFSLDLSDRALARAKEIGADCIFTHHPAIYNPLYSLGESGAGKNILACAKAGISVISSHLSLDCAEGGIDDCLMQGLGGTAAEAVMHPLSRGGYGKVFAVEETPLADFIETTRKRFHVWRAFVYGGRPVKKIASFCGAGMDDATVAFAIASGADTFVSADGKHHLIA
ncbi:MAG: Nif3-like dinuclear metal center hexameric protein, partial [Clostridia bacterium]|nr:Nif3-like dinuclear metal center hexameric protein [Clostridia bacterium]